MLWLITTDVPRKTFDKLVPHGIGNAGENNWDSGSCALSGNRGSTGYCDQWIRLKLNQFGREADEQE